MRRLNHFISRKYINQNLALPWCFWIRYRLFPQIFLIQIKEVGQNNIESIMNVQASELISSPLFIAVKTGPSV